MAGTKRMIGAAIAVSIALLSAGCGASNRSADEWLSLSISGLEGMDEYSFAGQSVTSLPNGVTYSPKQLEGHIVDHQVLSASKGASGISPSAMLLALQSADKEVAFGEQPADANQISLKVKLSDEASKKLLSGYVWNEFEQIALNPPDENAPYRAEWDKELNRSRKELQSRLASLSAQTDFNLIVDRNRMLPVEVLETSVLTYEKDGSETKETRSTNISLSSFNGVHTNAAKRK